ncbi:MAG: hypothetical protein ABUL61_02345, partial [Oleiharenicola lentus]
MIAEGAGPLVLGGLAGVLLILFDLILLGAFLGAQLGSLDGGGDGLFALDDLLAGLFLLGLVSLGFRLGQVGVVTLGELRVESTEDQDADQGDEKVGFVNGRMLRDWERGELASVFLVFTVLDEVLERLLHVLAVLGAIGKFAGFLGGFERDIIFLEAVGRIREGEIGLVGAGEVALGNGGLEMGQRFRGLVQAVEHHADQVLQL